MCYHDLPKAPRKDFDKLDLDALSKPFQTAQQALSRSAQGMAPAPKPMLHKRDAIDATVQLLIEAHSNGSPFAMRVVNLCQAHLHMLAGSYETSK